MIWIGNENIRYTWCINLCFLTKPNQHMKKIKFALAALLAIAVGFAFDAYLTEKTHKKTLTSYFLLQEDGTISKGENPSLDFSKIIWKDCIHSGVQIPFLYGKPILSKIGDANGAMYTYHPYLEDKKDVEWNISTLHATELNRFLQGGIKYPNLTSDEMKGYQLVVRLKRELGGLDVFARLLIEGKESLPDNFIVGMPLDYLVETHPEKVDEKDIVFGEWAE